MLTKQSPRIHSLATANLGNHVPVFVWSAQASRELEDALANNFCAFLLGEISEEYGQVRLSVLYVHPFPEELRPEAEMSDEEWQILDKEVQRLAPLGLVGIGRHPEIGAGRRYNLDRKVLERYASLGIRCVAVMEPIGPQAGSRQTQLPSRPIAVPALQVRAMAIPDALAGRRKTADPEADDGTLCRVATTVEIDEGVEAAAEPLAPSRANEPEVPLPAFLCLSTKPKFSAGRRICAIAAILVCAVAVWGLTRGNSRPSTASTARVVAATPK